ncbi:type I 3-dehydroquinate dehydratase [bacterium 210820-DFI.6.37]|nr:type I 3-dehydroquinate dehydratase [bacterium 210820-DFI.6.37]
MKKLTIGDLTLGEGLPKICIPLTGASQEELLSQAELAETLPCQMVEWRADYMLAAMKEESLQRKAEKLKTVLGYLRMELDMPLIFTIRTAKEGGRADVTKDEYFFINELIAEGAMTDFIDIETFDAPGKVDEARIREFIRHAHDHGTKVLLSNHDFEKTPDLEEMLARYFVMQELEGDVMKLAVMPHKEDDVFYLLEVAAMMRDTYARIPFIAISMGELGASTRICGGEFGSVITFAAGADASAPGQMDAATLSQHLSQYYG